MSALLPLYRMVTTLAAPVISHHLNRRLESGKEDRARFQERLGQAGLPRPDAALIWVHAASVGESLTMLPLVEALLAKHPELRVLVTSGTVTSAGLLAERLPQGAFHQYVPVDRATYVNAFLDHWRPDLVLWAESEFWPNLTTLAAGRGIPMVLINGRISPESFARWRRWPGLARRILQSFRLCLAQADIDAERLSHLGASQVVAAGNLKFAVPPLPADLAELGRMVAMIGTRPHWLAASTHPGEEALVWQAHKRIAERHQGLLTMIVPRHPDRGAAVAEELKALGARTARRAAGDDITAETDVYVADTMGELGLFFRLAPVSFMGKSLIDLGGQNPIEPARLGSAILFGPHMWNFPDVSARLVATGAAETVPDAGALGNAVAGLLDDPALCRRRADAAIGVAEAEAGVLDNVLGHLEPLLRAALESAAR
jgi:3-deoxy-D-manno-octulosonic-acid transferase